MYHLEPLKLGGAGIPRLGGQAYYEVMVEEYDDLKSPSRTGEELLLHQKHRMALYDP